MAKSKRTRTKGVVQPSRGSRPPRGSGPKSVLRDKIPRNVHTLFVGINPGKRSAEIGHYYGGHSNHFWRLLSRSGIWPTPLTTYDDGKLVEQGFGLTDMAKRPTSSASQLRRSDFEGARKRLERIAREYEPKTIVFVGKTAARAYLENNGGRIRYGLQDWQIHESSVFLLPSTSGASQGDTSIRQKLNHFRRLQSHIEGYFRMADTRRRQAFKKSG